MKNDLRLLGTDRIPTAAAVPVPSDADYRRAARARWETEGILDVPLDAGVRMDDACPDAGAWVALECWIDSAEAEAVVAPGAMTPYTEPQSLVPAIQDLLDDLAVLLLVLPPEWERVAELVGWTPETAAERLPAFTQGRLAAPAIDVPPFLLARAVRAPRPC